MLIPIYFSVRWYDDESNEQKILIIASNSPRSEITDGKPTACTGEQLCQVFFPKYQQNLQIKPEAKHVYCCDAKTFPLDPRQTRIYDLLN